MRWRTTPRMSASTSRSTGTTRSKRWMDICLSVEHLIDPHSMFLNRGPMETKVEQPRRDEPAAQVQGKDYLDRWINPPEKLEAEAKKLREQGAKMRHRHARPGQRGTCLLYLLRTRPDGRLAGGLPIHRPRGELLLCAAGDDEGNERGMGLLNQESLVFTDRGVLPMGEHRRNAEQHRVDDGIRSSGGVRLGRVPGSRNVIRSTPAAALNWKARYSPTPAAGRHLAAVGRTRSGDRVASPEAAALWAAER